MENLVKLRPEAQAKVDALFVEMGKARMKVLLKAFGLMMLSAPVTVVIAVANGLEQTSFPMVMGFATWILLNVSYIRPLEMEIGEEYGKKIKEVVEDERRAQAQEG